jgi:hypothetical protein
MAEMWLGVDVVDRSRHIELRHACTIPSAR